MRIFCVIVKGLSELSNGYTEAAIEVDEGVAGPKEGAELLAGDDLARGVEERDEEAKGLLLQLDASAVLEEFSGGGVYLERAELIDHSGMCLHTVAPDAVKD